MKQPKNAGKAPSMQWYPADWRKDTAVQMLSFHDRGVWFELINIMHESAERGVLVINGAPMPEDALSRLLGLDKQTFNQTLSNLLTYGVAKQRGEDGAIYCKRMVEDEKLSQLRRDAGKLGGNPVLLNQKSTTPVKQNPTPSSSSSSSSSSSNNTPKPPRGNEFTAVEIAVSAIHSSRTPKPFTPAERNSLNELRTRITDEELIADAEAIKNAKDKGWEFFARTRPAMLGKWESQADLARNYNPNRAKPPVKRDLSMFAF
jgi:hypothetical protein